MYRVSESTVAVIVPMYKEVLSLEEQISLSHLNHFLGKYDKYLITPHSLKPGLRGFGNKSFDDEFFKNTSTYSALMLSKDFYQKFNQYEYILIYQLDSLVFSDQLLEWCRTDLDYIGAPWLKSEYTPHVQAPTVGNGGFSLRKVRGFLKVLNSKNYCIEPDMYWQTFCDARPKYSQCLNLPRKYLKRFRRFNGVGWETAKWTKEDSHSPNEDIFWSLEAVKYFPEFKIASVAQGLRFAFEVFPRQCFELNNKRLPFGCHAWAKYDRNFWEPYLLK